MIHIDEITSGLQLFKVLGSEVRLEILKLLANHRFLNMNELASCLKLTNGAITAHVKALEELKLIGTKTATGKHGIQKICYLHEDSLLIDLKQKISGNLYTVEIGVGHFSNYQIYPTCGLATKDKIIGICDEPRYFADPERINADIIWFSRGFIEYRVPNYLQQNQTLSEIQFILEIGSEAPGYNNAWPSDIYFYLNNNFLGFWTSPGDFGDAKGIFTPSWWLENWNQYGLLKLISVNQEGTFVDGLKISSTNLNDLDLTYKSDLLFKMEVSDSAHHIGGLTLYGKNFGNYNQGIQVRVLWNEKI